MKIQDLRPICVRCGELTKGGIIRTQDVCNRCYGDVKRDNRISTDEGLDISNSIIIREDIAESQRIMLKKLR